MKKISSPCSFYHDDDDDDDDDNDDDNDNDNDILIINLHSLTLTDPPPSFFLGNTAEIKSMNIQEDG